MTIKAAQSANSHDIKGLLYFLAACALFAFINSVLKKLSIALTPYEIMGYRTLIASLVTAAISLMLIRRIPIKPLRKDNIFRASIELVGMPLWVICLSNMDISQAVALSFTTPIFAAILASVFLQDRMKRSSMICCLVGLIGAIVVINPNSEQVSIYSLLTLGVCICWALGSVFIKKLTSSQQHPLHIVLYTNLILALAMSPVIISSSNHPKAAEWQNIIILALAGLAAHLFLASAMRYSQLSKLLPFDYTRLIFSAMFAYIFFGEIASNNTILGSLLIFMASTYVAISIAKDQGKAGQKPPSK